MTDIIFDHTSCHLIHCS